MTIRLTLRRLVCDRFGHPKLVRVIDDAELRDASRYGVTYRVRRQHWHCRSCERDYLPPRPPARSNALGWTAILGGCAAFWAVVALLVWLLLHR